jgi:hypothetical protein
MRAKTLLLTAALSAVSIAAAVAQTVYSVNAVGYVNVTVPAGKFALLSNPLNQPTNSIAAVLPDVANNTVVYVFDPTTGAFTQTTKRAGVWTGAAATALLNPGQGFFIKNAGTADMTVTFVGEVPQGTNLTINFPKAGFYLVGSIVPQAGKVQTDLGLPAVNGDKVYQFSTASQGYNTLTKRAGTTWTGTGGEPTVAVAEAFFYQASTATATAWTRSFSVNQ